MPGSVRDDEDTSYVCLHCDWDRHYRCSERACTCCAGVPEDVA